MFNEDDLRRDIKQWQLNYAKKFCSLAADALTKTASYAIQTYYDSYEPKYYERTYNLLKNSYHRYYKNNGNKIYGGVQLSPEWMKEYDNKSTDKEKVFTSGWYSGQRYLGKGKSMFIYPPATALYISASNRKFINELQAQASAYARAQKYSVLTKIL